jgi:hypothetical protein
MSDPKPFDSEALRRRMYSPEALARQRAEGFLDDPTTKEFPRFQTRFAPNDSGPLHAGGALCLLMNYIWARISGTKVLLRFERHDMCDWMIPSRGDDEFERCRKSMAMDIDWLGMAEYVQDAPPLVIKPGPGDARLYDWLSGYQAQPGVDQITLEIARLDDDRRLGVNMVVRGWDLYSFSYLYHALSQRIYGASPFFTFIPVLYEAAASSITKADEVRRKLDKSAGSAGVRELGMDRDRLIGRLYTILAPGDPRPSLTPDEAVEAFVLSWRKDRRWTSVMLTRYGLAEAPPAWKPIRPPSLHSDFGGATSIAWDGEFVERGMKREEEAG